LWNSFDSNRAFNQVVTEDTIRDFIITTLSELKTLPHPPPDPEPAPEPELSSDAAPSTSPLSSSSPKKRKRSQISDNENPVDSAATQVPVKTETADPASNPKAKKEENGTSSSSTQAPTVSTSKSSTDAMDVEKTVPDPPKSVFSAYAEGFIFCSFYFCYTRFMNTDFYLLVLFHRFYREETLDFTANEVLFPSEPDAAVPEVPDIKAPLEEEPEEHLTPLQLWERQEEEIILRNLHNWLSAAKKRVDEIIGS
jgi:DNA mismatch repair ATPase MutL